MLFLGNLASQTRSNVRALKASAQGTDLLLQAGVFFECVWGLFSLHNKMFSLFTNKSGGEMVVCQFQSSRLKI